MRGYICLLGFVLLLAVSGCGNKKFPELVVEQSPPSAHSVTLAGTVSTGAAQANKAIFIEVGDWKFKAKTDANGNYTRKLEVDEAHASIPVKISAQLDSAQPNLILFSILPSVSVLESQAGADKVLSAQENSDVNLTFVSTALFGQFERASDLGTQQKIDTNLALQTAITKAHLDESLSVAVSLYWAEMGGNGLQVGSDTLAFVRDAVDTRGWRALKERDETKFNALKTELAQKSQFYSAPKIVQGDFVLYGSPGGKRLKFNADLTGTLGDGVKFKWRQSNSASVTPSVDLEIVYNDVISPSSDEYVYSMGGIKSVQLLFSKYYPLNKHVQFLQYKDASAEGNAPLLATTTWGGEFELFNLADALNLTADKLVGEWFDKSIFTDYRYQFGIGGTVDVIRLGAPHEVPLQEQTQDRAYWSVEGKQLSLDHGDGRIDNFWFFAETGAGYRYLKWNDLADGGLLIDAAGFTDGELIRSRSLELSRADFLGIWAEEDGGLRIMDESGLMYLGFGIPYGNWGLDLANNRWVHKSYTESSPLKCASLDGQDPACILWSQIPHQVVAVDQDSQYILTELTSYSPLQSGVIDFTNTADQDLAKKQFTYQLNKVTRIEPPERFGAWMVTGYTKTFYRLNATQNLVWVFSPSGHLNVADRVSPNVPSTPNIPYLFSDGNFHYLREGVQRELQLISSDSGGLIVCEFNEGLSCAQGEKFYLSNKDPVDVKLNVSGLGKLSWSKFRPNLDGGEYDPTIGWNSFGNQYYFLILPNLAEGTNRLKSISGCDGQVINGYYVTATLTSSCTITAVFEPAS